MAAVTRLGLYGGSRGLYGDFSTKEPGTPVEVVTSRPKGGFKFLVEFEDFREKRDSDKSERDKIREEITAIEDVVDREIAQILQQDTIKEAREKELKALESLVATSFRNEDIPKAKVHGVAKELVRAAVQGNFSAMEALERKMDRLREDEEFLMLAMVILD
ncbi:MAG: hypothetical protein V3V85_06885 [Candidatus Thorarchaeota archaeon]